MEQGTHEQLMAGGEGGRGVGEYASLVKMQMAAGGAAAKEGGRVADVDVPGEPATGDPAHSLDRCVFLHQDSGRCKRSHMTTG